MGCARFGCGASDGPSSLIGGQVQPSERVSYAWDQTQEETGGEVTRGAALGVGRSGVGCFKGRRYKEWQTEVEAIEGRCGSFLPPSLWPSLPHPLTAAEQQLVALRLKPCQRPADSDRLLASLEPSCPLGASCQMAPKPIYSSFGAPEIAQVRAEIRAGVPSA